MATVLITGASGGIGKDLAAIFAANKYDLILVARSKDMLEKIAEDLALQYGIKAIYFDIDLSKPNSARQLYDEVKKSSININILVNNAGVGLLGETVEMDLEKINGMLALNMNALTDLCFLFGGDMKRARSGKILNIASTAAFQPTPYLGIYAASKAYVLHFSEALYVELKKYGVQVTASCPGPTVTGFAKAANMEDSKLFRGSKMSSKEVATLTYKALMKNKMTTVLGLKNKLLAMSVRFAPRKLVAFVGGKLVQ